MSKHMPGHFDGDGCVFPTPGHFTPRPTAPLSDLARVVDSASEIFTTEGVTQWLSHPQRIGDMGGLTPRQAIAQGKTDVVLRLLEGLKDGVVL